MRLAVVTLFAFGAACGGGNDSPHLDGGSGVDAPRRADGARAADAATDAAQDAALGPYAHTIAIDGADDFAAGERFATTSAGYEADVTWDATNVYVGYHGDDLASGDGEKWLFIFIDSDPGTGSGATHSQTYNTQSATFPAGFAPDHYARFKMDYSFATMVDYDGGVWTDEAAAMTYAHDGTFLEVAIPRTTVGSGATAGLLTYMINEGANVEGTYAGIYPDNFTDGYFGAGSAVGHYLLADFGSNAAPNDPSNEH